MDIYEVLKVWLNSLTQDYYWVTYVCGLAAIAFADSLATTFRFAWDDRFGHVARWSMAGLAVLTMTAFTYSVVAIFSLTWQIHQIGCALSTPDLEPCSPTHLPFMWQVSMFIMLFMIHWGICRTPSALLKKSVYKYDIRPRSTPASIAR